jgi:hypothetical protein
MDEPAIPAAWVRLGIVRRARRLSTAARAGARGKSMGFTLRFEGAPNLFHPKKIREAAGNVFWPIQEAVFCESADHDARLFPGIWACFGAGRVRLRLGRGHRRSIRQLVLVLHRSRMGKHWFSLISKRFRVVYKFCP